MHCRYCDGPSVGQYCCRLCRLLDRIEDAKFRRHWHEWDREPVPQRFPQYDGEVFACHPLARVKAIAELIHAPHK